MEIKATPTTTYNARATKKTDGKSVKVTVPESTTLALGDFTVLDGFHGFAMQEVETGAGETAEIALNIEQAVYETKQITTTEAFTKGVLVYWNATTSKLTVTASTNRAVGRVVRAKDANNVIHMLMGPQVY